MALTPGGARVSATQQESGTSVDIGLRQQFTACRDSCGEAERSRDSPSSIRRCGACEARAPSRCRDITVTLDGSRTARTDAAGAYAFDNVSPGTHRIAAQLPASPRAFFTTPSHSETKVPAHIDFGLVWAAARIDGRVISDAGNGIGARCSPLRAPNGRADQHHQRCRRPVRLRRSAGNVSRRTRRRSRSLPAIRSPGSTNGTVTVEPDLPQTISFEVQALRSIAGRAQGASEVRIESLDRTARVDAEGNFVFRSMPAGTFTITARSGGRTSSRTVTLPAEPAMIRECCSRRHRRSPPPNRDPPYPLVRRKGPHRRRGPVPRAAHGAFRVQAGAFRSAGERGRGRQRIERIGGHAEITRSGSLDLVTVGPLHRAKQRRPKRAGLQGSRRRCGRRWRWLRSFDRGIAVSGGPHVVQAGALPGPRNARQLVGRLSAAGEKPFTVATELTLVYVGPFETRHDAVAARERSARRDSTGS